MATNSKKTETLVGVFLFLGLAMLGTIILLFGNIGDLFKKRYEIKVNFKEAAGIIKGSTVRSEGSQDRRSGGETQAGGWLNDSSDSRDR
jgi:phospholipid/cholesterol/gamma-HCH transport system substrate-binding protein